MMKYKIEIQSEVEFALIKHLLIKNFQNFKLECGDEVFTLGKYEDEKIKEKNNI